MFENLEENYEIREGDRIRFHISADDRIRLSELCTCMELISESFDDIKKETLGISRKSIEADPVIESLENGSVILTVITTVALPIAINIFSNYLYDRLKNHFKNKINVDKSQVVNNIFDLKVHITNNGFELELHINNIDFNWK